MQPSSKFLCLATLLLVSIPAAAQKRIPVILSTDVGNEIDDQWAIVYLLVSPEFDVRGIASAHAPSIAAPAGRVSYLILRDIVENRMNMLVHPPLLQGADVPLQDPSIPRESEAVDFILEESRKFSSENRLNVLTIGAFTDMASVILRDRSVINRVRVIDMGFRSWDQGAQGEEYNIQNDPRAAQVVLNSGVPLVVGAGQVCRENLRLSLDKARVMMENRGPIGKWLWDEFAAWYYRFIKPLRKEDFTKPWIIWDTVVLAYLLGMTEEKTYPRPELQDNLTFRARDTKDTVIWITDVDEERMWSDFLKKLDHYQRTHHIGVSAPTGRLTSLLP